MLELETANRFPQGDANPACADHADDGGGADVGLKAVQGVGDQERHHLRQDAVKDLFDFIGAGGANAFHRTGLDGFDRLGKQLGEHAGGVNEQRHDARERTEADGDHEQHRKDHFVDRPTGVHQAAHGLVYPPRHDVFSAHQAKRNGENNGQRGAPDGDLQGDRHFTEVVLPLAEVRREEVGGEGRHIARVFEEQQRIHFRALPGDNQHRQQDGPAYEREPAALRRREGDGLHVLLLRSLCAGWRYAYPAYDPKCRPGKRSATGRKALLHRFIHAGHRAERGGQAVEVFKLGLNRGHFAGLLLVLQAFVVLHALHLFKQRQLANRDQLQVA